ncbi:MAG: hypothetical protein SF029_02435, partial [bacterium]|nr:hypothetical protein [bacterium]
MSLNVRANATVAITGAQPRSGNGSLEFTTNTIVSGQDKADYVKYWGVVSGRTLGNLSALSYEFYRASSSTNANYFAPAFRLAYATTGGQTGYLVWEPIYNGYSTVTEDTWNTANIFAGNFWMRAFGPGRTIEVFDVTLAEWISGLNNGGPIGGNNPHTLSSNT